jgi:isopenicillin-N epimerase
MNLPLMLELGAQLRSEFLLDPALRFLNHGSFGATPRSVLEAQSYWRRELERNPVAFVVDRLPGAQRQAAERLAGFLGTVGDNLGFVENATTGVNAVLRSLAFSDADEILTTNHVYGAVRQALRYVCSKTGARLRVVEVPFPVEAPEQVLNALDLGFRENTRLAVLDHITSSTGLILPIREMVAMCRERGVRVLVDGAHAPGHVALNLEEIGADWYTGNAHKWLFAPKGCAFLYAAPQVQHLTHPTVISHDYEAGFVPEFDYTGTKDPSAWLAVEAALDFVDSVGVERMRAHNTGLAREAGELLRTAWGSPRLAPDSMLGFLVTLQAPPGALGTTLDEAISARRFLLDAYRTEVPVFGFGERNWVRISAQVYNELSDYEPLAEAVLQRASKSGALP